MNLNRSALACAVVRELPETSSYTDRDSLMFEDLGRRVHSSGDHLDGLPHRQANALNINQDQLQEFQAYFQQGSLPTIEELPEPPEETQGEMLQALEIIVEIVDPNQTGISEILPPENNNFEGPEEKEEEPKDNNNENFVTNKDGDNKYEKEAMTMTWETEVDLETRSSIVHFDDSSLFVEKSEYYSINFEDEPNDLNTSDASTMCNALDLGVHSTMSKDEEFEEPLDEELSDDTLEDDLFRDPLEAEEHCGDSLEEQYWDVYYDEFQVV